MQGFIQVESTTSTKEEATSLAKAILTERLAACVQISGPITSHYHWQGKLEEEEEYQFIIKTHQSLLPELTDLITRLHSYDCPQILSLPAEFSAAYAAWAKAELNLVIT